ncbi:MAG: agmatine deiminase [Lachnospiraceae bacterium]|nr:agmatine deiminase [Lachnospiraceae bacterium]
MTGQPAADGFCMPGEFEAHSGCIMIWPKRPGSWNYGAVKAREAFAAVARAIAESEPVYMLAAPDVANNARTLLAGPGKNGTACQIQVIEIDSDDAWARDVAPTFVRSQTGEIRGIDWAFNAWGGAIDGLYAHWEKDDLVARRFCEWLGCSCYDAHPFVLEGGSIHSDGQGTVLVTEACLLSAGRNPSLSKAQIEECLMSWLGAETIIWLPRGIYKDETNEHVDNICAFVRPAEVVLAWTEDKEDPQYALSMACYAVLSEARDARGRRFLIHKLPIPAKPVCIQEEDLKGYVFEPGEDVREAGERLAASYVNFYISNGGVIVPQFGDENDPIAVTLLTRLFPERNVCPIPAREILLGGGNIHCITQQIPAFTPHSLEKRKENGECEA